MIAQGFDLGDKDWYVEAYYNVYTDEDIVKIQDILSIFGCDQDIYDLMSRPNTGYTFTNFKKKSTIILVSHTQSPEQMYDTIQHELKHVVEHISEYYDVNPKSETAAYLQGEIARQMFPAAAMAVCPRYHR